MRNNFCIGLIENIELGYNGKQKHEKFMRLFNDIVIVHCKFKNHVKAQNRWNMKCIQKIICFKIYIREGGILCKLTKHYTQNWYTSKVMIIINFQILHVSSTFHGSTSFIRYINLLL